jgi:tetraacyldisaccharide 4'-kinase
MRKLLIPLSVLFRIIVFIRNKFYDFNFIKSFRLKAVVISVGNLSAGGTGKTPLVEWIARYLMQKGKFIAVITKGYKRIHDDIKVAEFGYINKEHKLTAGGFGDESLILLENLSDTDGKGLLVVSDNKRSGAKLADSKFKPDAIIIDDGFQHRELKRDVDIVILNHDFRQWMIPAGNYRESLASLRRANVIVMNHKFGEDKNEKPKKITAFVETIYKLECFKDFRNQKIEKIGKALCFCGIGDPDSFKELLKAQNVECVKFIEFPDHHNFLVEDIDKIQTEFKQSGAECIVTTQKDFMRIKYSDGEKEKTMSFLDLLNNYPLYFALIRMEIIKNEHLITEKIRDLFKD